MNNLYSIIVSLCEEKQISIAKMAIESGISKNTLTELKKGRTKTLSAKTLDKISSYFDVSVDYLLGKETDEKEKSPILSDEASELDIQILNALKELSEEQKAQALDFALFLANNSKK